MDRPRDRRSRLAREERRVAFALAGVTVLIALTIIAGLGISRELKQGADDGYVNRALPLSQATTDLALRW
jgi:hypothetical protein